MGTSPQSDRPPENWARTVRLMNAASAAFLHVAGINHSPGDADLAEAADHYGRLLDVSPAELKALMLHIAKFRADPDLVALAGEPYAFRKQGQMWTVAFNHVTIHLQDALGPAYIAHLLAAPGCKIPAADMVASVYGVPVAKRARASAGSDRSDAYTLRDVGQRLATLRKELDEARANHDLGCQERVQAEIDQLTEYVDDSLGCGGRLRRMTDDVDRMGRSIHQAISRTTKAMEKDLPACARHLDNAIRTGRFISYEPEEDLPWAL
jgi:hypothetical protein